MDDLDLGPSRKHRKRIEFGIADPRSLEASAEAGQAAPELTRGDHIDAGVCVPTSDPTKLVSGVHRTTRERGSSNGLMGGLIALRALLFPEGTRQGFLDSGSGIG